MAVVSNVTTLAILKMIQERGYTVSIHRLTGKPPLLPEIYTEMHAVKLSDTGEQHIVRVDDQGADADYQCVCRLADSVGIALEDFPTLGME
jgi:hypothetical protein